MSGIYNVKFIYNPDLKTFFSSIAVEFILLFYNQFKHPPPPTHSIFFGRSMNGGKPGETLEFQIGNSVATLP